MTTGLSRPGINSSANKGLPLAVLVLLFCLLFITTETHADIYYLSPEGDDGNAGTFESPWARFDRAMSVLKPGDTLLLKDGIYKLNNSGMLNVTVSGEKENYITVKAVNDGAVIIDGEYIDMPCRISSVIYTVLEGVICRNSIANALSVSTTNDVPILTDGTFYNVVRRVSAYDAGGHNDVILLHNSNILLEDCIEHGSGNGNGYIGIGTQKMGSSTSYITIRRCIAFSTGDPAIALYETNDSTVENNIVFHTGQNDFYWGGTPWGIQINATDYDQGSNNTVRGNLVIGNNTGNTFFGGFGITDRFGGGQNIGTNSIFENNVVIDAYNSGIYQNNGTGVVIRNNTTVFKRPPEEAWTGNNYKALYIFPWFSSDNISSTVTNNSHSGNGGEKEFGFELNEDYQVNMYLTPSVEVSASHNNYFNFLPPAAIYAGLAGPSSIDDSTLAPDYPVSLYGHGAYLMPPLQLKGLGANGSDLGAEVLYRYQDGVLTELPLWPWPMESRAVAELGRSITYANNGGLWKTLAGVYEVIALSASSLDFTTERLSSPANQTIEIYNSGFGTLNWTASVDSVSTSWLSVFPQGSTGDGMLTVSVNASDLPAGTYTGTITITAPAVNSPQSANVTLVVMPRPPLVLISHTSLNITTTVGTNPPERSLTLSNGGDLPLEWTAAGDSPSWLTIGPESGTGDTVLTISFNSTGLSAGLYTGAITITASGAKNSPIVIPVTLLVEPLAVFATNSGGGQYTSLSGNIYQADKNYSGGYIASTKSQITGTSDSTLYQSERYGNFSYNVPLPNGNHTVKLRFAEIYWNAAGQRVFNVSMQGTQVISRLDIFAKVGKNAAYDVIIPVKVTTGMLNIVFAAVADNAKVSSIEITQSEVSPPVVVLEPASLNFSAVAGTDPSNQTVNISNSGGGTLNWTAEAGSTSPAWLSVGPASGTGSSAITVSVNSSGLNPGTYTNSITIAAPGATNSPRTVNVSLTVSSSTTVNSTGINSGGQSYTNQSGGPYQGDKNYSGGYSASTSSAISGTSDDILYQSERYGNFSYTVPLANGSYTVTLRFAEIYWTEAGRRIFNVIMQGTEVISKLDIYSKVGKNAAYDVTLPAIVTDGVLNIKFMSVYDNAKVSAIEITGDNISPPPPPTPPPAGSAVFINNSGGGQYTSQSGIIYSSDSNYSGGYTASTNANIAGTSDISVYQSERYGNFSYDIPLVDGNYSVTFKFAEIYWSASSYRVFNVFMQGTEVISKLDIYAKAGKDTAYDVTMPVSVTGGILNIKFVSVTNNAKVSAILVTSQ